MEFKRVKDLGQNNRKKLYEALVTSKLCYPSIPLHCLGITAQRSLQRVQNSGARYITNIKRRERKTNEYIHRKADLQPVNIKLYERALKTWNKIRTTLREDWHGVLTYRAQPKRFWPLSIPIVMGGSPLPVYR